MGAAMAVSQTHLQVSQTHPPSSGSFYAAVVLGPKSRFLADLEVLYRKKKNITTWKVFIFSESP
jgi:hypothetical protein